MRTSEFQQELEKAAAKRVSPRSVSAAASWQYVVGEGLGGTTLTPDYVGRATAKERAKERFVTQRAARALRRDLVESGNGPEMGLNDELLSGCAALPLPADHPMHGAAEMLLFVGPVAEAKVIAESRAWSGHRNVFKRQAVKREVAKAALGWVESNPRRRQSLRDVFGC